MDLIFPDWPDAPSNVGAFSTSRRGGFSKPPYDDGKGGGGLNLGLHVGDDPEDVEQNRRLLQSLLPAQPVWLNQVHGTIVVDAAAEADTPSADASVTNQRGVVCAIQTADCLPVLFCDVAGNVVGAAHAGWRGLAGGVLQNTVQAMRSMGAIDILAWLGPAIGPEQFEVGEDVLQAFSVHGPETETAFKPRSESTGKYLADIYQLARIVLAKHGVTKIHGGENCTVSDTGRFYSYRRDRITGRMTSLIWIK